MSSTTQHWTQVITPEKPLFHIPLREIWQYRELLWMFIRRPVAVSLGMTLD